jgi:hypothetical protein
MTNLATTKNYSPSVGSILNSTLYNTDISALFNNFIGLEAQTTVIKGLTLIPSVNGTTKFKITNTATIELLSADTTNSYIKLKATTKLYLGASYLTESSANVVDLYVGATNALKASATYLYAPQALRIGADSANNGIDDATGGTSSTSLYIGNQSIVTSSNITGGGNYFNIGTSWDDKDSIRAWNKVAVSTTGKYQTAVVSADDASGYIYISSDYGETWTEKTTASETWEDVAMSSTGQYQTAVSLHIWRSIDYGTNWLQATSDSTRGWSSIAVSSTGQYQTATTGKSSPTTGKIYISSDYGENWGEVPDIVGINFRSTAISSTGQYQTVCARGSDHIYISSNYGASWTPVADAGEWQCVAMSSTGQYQTACIISGKIYISSNYGTTWEAKDSNRLWIDIAMSSNGLNQTAVEYGSGGVYVSTNYGVDWNNNKTVTSCYGVGMSSLGTIQTVVGNGDYIYTTIRPESIQFKIGTTTYKFLHDGTV